LALKAELGQIESARDDALAADDDLTVSLPRDEYRAIAAKLENIAAEMRAGIAEFAIREQHLRDRYQRSRLGLGACLKALREGDIPVVWKLDRFGRDLRHLAAPSRQHVHDLVERGVGFKVLTGHSSSIEATMAAASRCSGYSRYWQSSSVN
jgi:DNA invertase Pin-like site-specific DNA recombinase